MRYMERVAQLERRYKAAGHPEIVDEKCSCSHWRSEHNDHFDIGHGGCIYPKCTCTQFTWVGWIVKNGGKK